MKKLNKRSSHIKQSVVVPYQSRHGTRVVNLRTVHSCDVYCGRPSKYGNPYVIGRHGTRADVLKKYRAMLARHPTLVEHAREVLTGKTLGCWCDPEPCHVHILVEAMETW